MEHQKAANFSHESSKHKQNHVFQSAFLLRQNVAWNFCRHYVILDEAAIRREHKENVSFSCSSSGASDRFHVFGGEERMLNISGSFLLFAFCHFPRHWIFFFLLDKIFNAPKEEIIWQKSLLFHLKHFFELVTETISMFSCPFLITIKLHISSFLSILSEFCIFFLSMNAWKADFLHI